ncbi:MAG: carboxymuconolactone decarboxylase family protein [Myxococcota bacterium]|nr:carboxymuconolactone decarboxylase family protein [Myxococcota bacterium]MDW8363746.1 carboxymuconolactone decarboxylase family protein [Myxococcales bacterium]
MSGRLEALRESLPEFARDAAINLANVLGPGRLDESRRWGVAIAAAAATRTATLLDALVEEGLRRVGRAVVDDALAAASLMAMNNVYYRFRHFMQPIEAAYAERPARLRMQRIGRPATNPTDFELFCLAASAVGGCEACVRAHERAVRERGLSVDDIHEAIRIAAAVCSAAVGVELGRLPSLEGAATPAGGMPVRTT